MYIFIYKQIKYIYIFYKLINNKKYIVETNNFIIITFIPLSSNSSWISSGNLPNTLIAYKPFVNLSN